jgi:hypothetical protein
MIVTRDDILKMILIYFWLPNFRFILDIESNSYFRGNSFLGFDVNSFM